MAGADDVRLGRRPVLIAKDIAYAKAAVRDYGARTADIALELGVGVSTLYRSLGRLYRDPCEVATERAKVGEVWRARVPSGHKPRFVRIIRVSKYMCVVDVFKFDPKTGVSGRCAEWPVGVVERRFRRVR